MNQTVEELERALANAKDVYARMRVLDEITKRADPSLAPLVPAVIAQLDQGDDWVVGSAAQALAVIGDLRAIPALIRRIGKPYVLPADLSGNNAAYAHAMVASEEEGARLAVLHALGALFARGVQSEDAREALLAVAANERDDERVRSAAKDALARYSM